MTDYRTLDEQLKVLRGCLKTVRYERNVAIRRQTELAALLAEAGMKICEALTATGLLPTGEELDLIDRIDAAIKTKEQP